MLLRDTELLRNILLGSKHVENFLGKPVFLPPDSSTHIMGSHDFCRSLSLNFPYVLGSMATGISSYNLVISAAKAGLLSFFGAAGVPLITVEKTIIDIKQNLTDRHSFGVNLIHSPGQLERENSLVELFLKQQIKVIEASAFFNITSSLIKYRFKGTFLTPDGQIYSPHKILAKVSRYEIAKKFISPPSKKLLHIAVEKGDLSQKEASLAEALPVAQNITAEADSGGHTDNQQAISLFPLLLRLKEEINEKYHYATPVYLGAAGGIGTPESVLAAFMMGMDYIVTGSINQACMESGTSDFVKKTLASLEQSDFMMAPAADMFEMGINVQVTKKGTLFPMRARKLYKLYRQYGSITELPLAIQKQIEKQIFHTSFENIWNETKKFFIKYDPQQINRAEHDPKYKLALLFRWYLGQASQWAIDGCESRKFDYQIWCGPVMAAFNQWAKGSKLQDWHQRHVVNIAKNLMQGAIYKMRLAYLKQQGIFIPFELQNYRPLGSL